MKLGRMLAIDDASLEAFCRSNGVAHLAVFGSVLRDDFRAASDVDVLVEFQAGRTPGLLGLAQMEMVLGDLLGGREVELRTYEDLSPHFRDRVRATAMALYDAA